MLERRISFFICTKDDMACDPTSQFLVEECLERERQWYLQLDLELQAELNAEKPCPMRTAKVDFTVIQDWDAYQCEFSIET